MKLPSRRTVRLTLLYFGGVAVALGVVIVARKVAAAGALAASPALKPWIYAGGMATMWGAVAVMRVAKRRRVFAGAGRLEQALAVIMMIAAFAAVAAGFFAAVFNLPAGGDVLLRMGLFAGAMASGALTSRLIAL